MGKVANKFSAVCAAILVAATLLNAGIPNLNPSIKWYTIETDHFRLHYHRGLDETATKVAAILEELYGIYRNNYDLTLPEKTDVMVINSTEANGGAYDILNMFFVTSNGFDFNLRGTHDWLRDVVTHEYAHIVSISTAHKMPSWMPYWQFGFFSHPNNSKNIGDNTVSARTEAMHVFPGEILPPWLFEGIAQFESSRHGADRWDSHRDMILRTLTLSDKLLSWDHMMVFAGRGDDFEKTYNHGFSMVRYITETYGDDKIVALLRESSKLPRLDFDASVKAVFGFGPKKLYADWKAWLKKEYTHQVKEIGTQVYGKKINKEGYDNYWPRFSPDEQKIYFLSNGDHDYSYFYKSLYSYSLSDTIKEDERIKKEALGLKGFYSIHDSSGLVTYTSAKSRKSATPRDMGGHRVPDIFIDSLPPEKPKTQLFKKKKDATQVTEAKEIFHASFSPSGDMIAATKKQNDEFFLCMTDTAGNNFRILYPDRSVPGMKIKTMFSVDWSPDGHRIAVNYLDVNNRKIGIYDTLTQQFTVICDTDSDERDPRFSSDGKKLYFSSDRTGIFNIYRYNFETATLERLTNVSGGAFAPDISRDEKKLVYANYDADGYGIYLIDSVQVLEDSTFGETATVTRFAVPAETLTVDHTPRREYSFAPRKGYLAPTILAEQVVTEDDNVYQGKTAAKAGIVFSLADPALYSNFNQGNEIGGYFLIDPTKIFRFFRGRGLINPFVDYDLGLYGTTYRLPVPVSLDYSQRSITGMDVFFDEGTSEFLDLPYNITYYNTDLRVTYGSGDPYSASGMKLHLLGSLWATNVTLGLDELAGGTATYLYNASKGFDVGSYATMVSIVPEPTMSISPRGLYGKIRYQYLYENLIDDENSFDAETGEELYDTYQSHRVSLNLKAGFAAPWYEKHTLYFDVGGSMTSLFDVKGTDKNSFPYYYEPEILWHPGYAYYTRDTLVQKKATTGDSISVESPYYKGVVAGNAVTFGTFSYRFPLYPKSLDKKVWFLYLDRIFGVLNASAGAGWTDIERITDLKREDWLVSYGAEFRLEGQTFSRYPLAFKLAWENGIDRKAPVGGHRFSLGIGFSFDNWEYIDIPDYLSPARRSGRN